MTIPSSAERVLIVLAHPDDEIFALAATAARYVREGRTVAMVTLTSGGGGVWCGKEPEDPRSLTEVRRAELMCAANALGIEPLFIFDYPDGGLWRIAQAAAMKTRIARHVRRLVAKAHAVDEPSVMPPRSRLLDDVIGVIRSVRPQVIVSFGPEGLMGGHPDHRATHSLVRLAWRASRDEASPPRKLYYLSAPLGTVVADRLPRPPRITTHVYVRDFQACKLQAFSCYASQSHERGRLEHFLRWQGDWEVFSLAEGDLGPRDRHGLEVDLFA